MKRKEGVVNKLYRRKRGFSLVEIMIVIVLIGILNAIAIPALRNTRKQVQATRIANDFRQIRDSLEFAISELGTYPPDRNPGQYPPELVPYLPSEAWNRAIVGNNVRWDWDNWIGRGGRPFDVGLTLRYRGRGVDTELMTIVDDILDDGDLSTGTFRTETRYGGFVIVFKER